MRITRVCLIAGIFAATFGLVSARADEVTLTDQNSIARFNTGTQAGLFDWKVDAVDQVEKSWFWFRTDNGPESSIDTLVQSAINVLDVDGDPGFERLIVKYTSQDSFRVSLTYDLVGGPDGSGVASMPLVFAVDNIGQAPLSLQLFHYQDFNLLNTGQDDSVEITNGNRAVQSDGLASLQFGVIPRPSAFEAGFFPTTLNSLNDGGPTTLNGQGGPLGPGDLTFAFQQNVQLGPGQSLVGSETLTIVVPEPATAMLLLAALGLGTRMLRRSRREFA